ncbi:MAG: AMP-binding protein [Alphaproteobacteria bacterium]|nr:AMP-binding protein [Alphaproteobacteria bacterium]
MTALPNPLAASARARPAHPALETAEGTLDYRALAKAVARRAGALAAEGVRPGQVVALTGWPSRAWVVNAHALMWLGAAPAPLSPRARATERDAALAVLRPDHAVDGQDDAAGPPLDPQPWLLKDRRLVILSSGTTGPPRPIDLSAGQLVFSAMASALRLGHALDDRWLCCLPLHHVGGLSILLRCALYGTTARLHGRFDAAQVAAALDSGDVTLVSLVPAMLSAVLDARAEVPFPPRLRAALIGGAATPPALVARCRRLGVPVALTWGMTETASQVATRFPGDLDAPMHAGPPLPFAEVAAGPGGALVVTGPLAPGGRLETRDLGHLDDEGRVVVTGRRDDVIISGGENIDPAEVEAVLKAHPGVADAAVVGRPDPRWGERPVAWVVPAQADLQAEALIDWCRARLTVFKAPDAVFWLDALPRTELGKLSRSALLRQQPEPAQRRRE